MNVQIKAEPNKVKHLQVLLPEKQLVTVRRGEPTQATATATTHRCFGQHSHKGARVSREAVSQVVQRGSHNILAVGRGVRLRVAAPAQEGRTCYRCFYATPTPNVFSPCTGRADLLPLLLCYPHPQRFFALLRKGYIIQHQSFFFFLPI